MREFIELIGLALQRGDSFALGIISGIKGSSPQKQGAKALIYADGRIDGTLGGGCLEAELQRRARQALITNQPERFDLVLDHDFGWDDGLICGGRVTGLIIPNAQNAVDLWQSLRVRDRTIRWGVRKDFHLAIATQEQDWDDWLYQETSAPPCVLWVAGAGHVAQAVAPMALQLGFQVTVFDDRPALANSDFFPAETCFCVNYWDHLAQHPFPNQPTFGLVVTRGHQHDALALRHWLHRPFVFLGMIGSRRKKRLIFDQFINEKIATAERLSILACPVGVDILAESVPEIAVSIIAQLVEQRAAAVFGRSRKLRFAECISAGAEDYTDESLPAIK